MLKNYFNPQSNLFKYSLFLLGIGLCILVYLPGLPGAFVHDDFPNIVQNETLHIEQLDLRSVTSASFSSKAGPLKRPISMFSFSLNHYFSGLDPKSYKITNIVIHILTGLFLFFLTRLLINNLHSRNKEIITSNSSFYIALLVSTIWMILPINLTSVLYIVQRMTALSALFSVIGLLLYVLGRQSMILQAKLNIYYFFASGIFFIMSLLCKETGGLSLFYLICIEVFILRFQSNAILTSNVFRFSFLTLTLTPIAIALLWLAFDPSYIINGYDYRSFSLSERLYTQLRVIIYYLKWIIIPNISELGLFHDDITFSTSFISPITTSFSALVIIALILAGALARKIYPLAAFGIFFFFSSHLLESTVFNLEMIYEHRNYLASYGVILAIVTTIFYTVKEQSTQNIAIFICCLWLIALSTTTALRSQQWQHAITFAYYEAYHHPKSPRANHDLARAYANLTMAELLDEKEKALKLFEKSMQLMPSEIASEAAAIIFSGKINEKSNNEWVVSAIQKLNSYPITHITAESLKGINKCLVAGCSITPDQAFKIYQAAITSPITSARRNKSDVLTLYAEFAVNILNELDIAHSAMKEAIELTPNELQYRINLALLLIVMGKTDEASVQIEYVENHDKYFVHFDKIENLKKDLTSRINNSTK